MKTRLSHHLSGEVAGGADEFGYSVLKYTQPQSPLPEAPFVVTAAAIALTPDSRLSDESPWLTRITVAFKGVGQLFFENFVIQYI